MAHALCAAPDRANGRDGAADRSPRPVSGLVQDGRYGGRTSREEGREQRSAGAREVRAAAAAGGRHLPVKADRGAAGAAAEARRRVGGEAAGGRGHVVAAAMVAAVERHAGDVPEGGGRAHEVQHGARGGVMRLPEERELADVVHVAGHLVQRRLWRNCHDLRTS